MFWRKLGKRISSDSAARIESERERREELKKRLVRLFSAHAQSQFTIRHLENKLGQVSIPTLSLALAELQTEGIIDRILRVESPESHGGIRDYSSWDEIPNRLEDWRTGQTIEVTPGNTTLLFEAHKEHNLAKVNG